MTICLYVLGSKPFNSIANLVLHHAIALTPGPTHYILTLERNLKAQP